MRRYLLKAVNALLATDPVIAIFFVISVVVFPSAAYSVATAIPAPPSVKNVVQVAVGIAVFCGLVFFFIRTGGTPQPPRRTSDTLDDLLRTLSEMQKTLLAAQNEIQILRDESAILERKASEAEALSKLTTEQVEVLVRKSKRSDLLNIALALISLVITGVGSLWSLFR